MLTRFVINGLLLLSFALTSCEKNPSSQESWQTFAARDDGLTLTRPQLYHAKVPICWIRKDPEAHESIADTMKPNCEFTIMDNIRLTIHTFPITEKRIPPQAQIQRWKGQFEKLDPLQVTVTPQANGGFLGLLLEAEGQFNGKDQMMMGWSMNLSNEYENKLRITSTTHDQQKRADYTIKIMGPPQLLHKNRKSILSFVRSFELIDELPAPL